MHLLLTVFKVLALLEIMIYSRAQNLLCKADFEFYNLSIVDSGVYYNFLPADDCWYFKRSNEMEVIKWNYGNYSAMVELSARGPNYRICQNKTLLIGEFYNFTFQFALHNLTNTTFVNLTINGIDKKIQSESRENVLLNLTTFTYTFIANESFNAFCVGSVETWTVPKGSQTIATFVDNFELRTKSKAQVSYEFDYFYNYETESVSFVSAQIIDEYLINAFNENMTILFGNFSSNNFNLTVNVNGTLAIIFPISNYDPENEVSFNIPNFRYEYELYEFECGFTHLEDIQKEEDSEEDEPNQWEDPSSNPSLDLSQEDSEKFSSTLNILEQIQFNIFEVIFKNYPKLRIFGSSYLAKNFLTFYSIVVLYNYMCLSSQPSFSNHQMDNLAELYFSDEEFLMGFLGEILGDSFVEWKQKLESIGENGVTEKMKEKAENYIWFGTFGMTSSFFRNNIIEMLLLATFAFKFIALISLSALLSICWSYFKKRKRYLIKIFSMAFLVEIIVSSPSILISAFTSLLNSGSSSFLDQINLFLQMFVFSIIIHLPVVYLIMFWKNYCSIQKKNRRILLKTNEKICKQKFLKKENFMFWNELLMLLQYILHMLIPCLIVVSNDTAFFCIVSILLVLFVWVFIKGFKFYPIYKKIFTFFLIVVLSVHHFSFMFLFIVSKLNFSSMLSLLKICNYLGMIVIFTVIIGGLLELLDSLIETFHDLILPLIIKLKKLICGPSASIKKISKIKEKLKEKSLIPVDKVERTLIFQDQSADLSDLFDVKRNNNRQVKSLLHKKQTKEVSLTKLSFDKKQKSQTFTIKEYKN